MWRLFGTGSGPPLVEPPEAIYDEPSWPAPPEGRPHVAINMVMTADGRTTLHAGQHSRPIGSRIDRTVMVRLRAYADALVRGAGTVRKDPYHPSLPPDAPGRRAARGLAGDLLVVVVSASADLPVDAPLFSRAPRRPVVFTAPTASPERLDRLSRVADVLVAPSIPIDILWMLGELRSRYGVRMLLSEGGPTLNHAFFRAGAVDELFMTVAPFVAGRTGELAMVEGPALLEPFPALRLQSVHLHGSELFLRYAVERSPLGGEPAAGPGDGAAGPST